jgi:Tn3 transposase DDE domain
MQRHACCSEPGMPSMRPWSPKRWSNLKWTLKRSGHFRFGRPIVLSNSRLKLEYEQELWSECSRLIANCIIFYNASILSRLLEHQERTGDTQGAEATKKVCLVAWQHINLQGRFEFLKAPDALNVDAIIHALTTPQAGRVLNFVA